MPIAALLAIGNELLNGDIRDKNLFTLSRRLTRLGFRVQQAILARDEPDAIAEAMHILLSRPIDLLICSGGLGPTDDDLTLAALAQALDRPLAFDSDAYQHIAGHYERLIREERLHHPSPEATRRKMAKLPAGATPLPNSMGTAPGVALEYHGTLIYALPGVPEELEAIFAESIAPKLQARFETAAWAERAFFVHCDDEATLAPILHEVSEAHAEVYIKSLARPFFSAGSHRLKVLVMTHGEDASQAHTHVAHTCADLQAALQRAGFDFEPITPDEETTTPRAM
ncbi:MAG: competence/damage-inducible protein A [Anaerolineales bacterium]